MSDKALRVDNVVVQPKENVGVVKAVAGLVDAAMHEHLVTVDQHGDVALTRRWYVLRSLMDRLELRPTLVVERVLVELIATLVLISGPAAEDDHVLVKQAHAAVGVEAARRVDVDLPPAEQVLAVLGI